MNAKRQVYCVVLLLCSVIYGCSTTEPEYEEPKERTIFKERIIKKPYDQVWQSMVDWFATNNSPIKIIDKESGLIATEYKLSVSRGLECLDCGKPIVGRVTVTGKKVTFLRIVKHRGNFNVVVKKMDDYSTNVTINFFAEAQLNEYDDQDVLINSWPINCFSKGILETVIFDAISK